jgi:hypothetical protein
VSPNVVAVGGTNLQINTANGSYVSETGWSSPLISGHYGYHPGQNDGGSTGGYSFYESEPAYQQGVQQSGRRTVPDIAMDADLASGLYIVNQDSSASLHSPTPFPVGGTSLAAPLFAGVMALVDQYRAVNHGAGPLEGDSQTLPALYSLFQSTPGDFHTIQGGYTGFTAGPGYNLVTGLGSPVVNTFVPDLAGMDLPPAAPAQVTLTAQVSQVTQRSQVEPMSFGLSAFSSVHTTGFSMAPATQPPTTSPVPQTFQQPTSAILLPQPGAFAVSSGGSEAIIPAYPVLLPPSPTPTGSESLGTVERVQDRSVETAEREQLAFPSASPIVLPSLDWRNRDTYFADPGVRSGTLEYMLVPISSSTKGPEERHQWAAMVLGLALLSDGLYMIVGEHDRVTIDGQQRMPHPGESVKMT